MRTLRLIVSFVFLFTCPLLSYSENLANSVKKAAEHSTLDQPGTHPFHLKAMIAPSRERDNNSGRSGKVEYWWASPTQWKREVRSSEFHQILVVNGERKSQTNEGDYFPQWLEETAKELITPIPPLPEVLKQIDAADVKHILTMTHLDWTRASGTPETPNIIRGWVALNNNTGLLDYAGGLNWGAEFKNYANFHGRMVAKTVSSGSPEVTAKVTTLEDLQQSPGLFDIPENASTVQPLQTVAIDEMSLRKNLLPSPAAQWPPAQDRPLEGKFTTEIVVDRQGNVRQVGVLISDNPALSDAGKQIAQALRFTPFHTNGAPTQVISQITLPFKTVRPAGTEAFDSARNYFEHGRHAGFPAFGNGTPYLLHAEFVALDKSGTKQTGRYEDTWLNANHWRREVWFGTSHFVRSKKEDKTYRLSEGPQADLLALVMHVLEPIPAIDTFVESDWKIRRDSVDGVPAIRVLTGYVSPEGGLDPQVRAFWFDGTGLLIKARLLGLETRRTQFENFHEVNVARQIDILKDGKIGMKIQITELSKAEAVPDKTFEVHGHEWDRTFTDEAR